MAWKRKAAPPTDVDDRPFPPLASGPGPYAAIVEEAEQAAERGDIATIVRMMSTATDWRSASRVMYAALGDIGPEPPLWVTQLVATSPTDPLTLTIQGACLTHQAWAVRGSGWSDTVGDDAWDRFHELLRQADACLRDALRQHPSNSLAWQSMMAVCMGLQFGQDEIDQLYLRSHEHCPNDLDIQVSYLQPIVEKWGGSHEKAIGFARWASAQRPVGDPGHFLIAYAHIENVLMNKDEGRSPEVIAEIRDALDRSRLADPAWGDDRWGIFGKNVFAIAAYGQNDHDLARFLMQQIGLDERRIDGPWGYYGGGGENKAYLRIGRRLGMW